LAGHLRIISVPALPIHSALETARISRLSLRRHGYVDGEEVVGNSIPRR
jgi:hypothetical protein